MNKDQYDGAKMYFDEFIEGCMKAKRQLTDKHMQGFVDSIMDFASATMFKMDREANAYAVEEAEAMAELREDR